MNTDPRIEKTAIAIWAALGNNPGDWVYMAPEDPRPQWAMRAATDALAAADKAAIITTEAELDALPEGTVIMCANVNPTWPDVFLHTGAREPWLALDPADREDGEATLHSGTVLNWHGKGEVRVLHFGGTK